MGTFEGHVIPSIIYSILALWWGFVTAVRFIRADKNPKLKFKSSTAMPCFFCPTRKLRTYPIESFIKLTFLSIHATVEILTGLHRVQDGHMVLENENAHHVCMISGFIIGSIVEILIYYGVPFPKRTEYYFNLLSFFIQAALMSQHLNGDAGLEYEVHKLWTFVIVFTFVAACLEVYKPNNFWIVYMRVFFFLTQGTWLMQIAFVVWPKTTNPMFIWKMDHSSHTWLSISLMFHFLGSAIMLMIEYLIVNCLINKLDKYYHNYEFDIENMSTLQFKGYEKTSNENDKKEYSFLINEDEEI